MDQRFRRSRARAAGMQRHARTRTERATLSESVLWLLLSGEQFSAHRKNAFPFIKHVGYRRTKPLVLTKSRFPFQLPEPLRVWRSIDQIANRPVRTGLDIAQHFLQLVSVIARSIPSPQFKFDQYQELL